LNKLLKDLYKLYKFIIYTNKIFIQLTYLHIFVKKFKKVCNQQLDNLRFTLGFDSENNFLQQICTNDEG